MTKGEETEPIPGVRYIHGKCRSHIECFCQEKKRIVLSDVQELYLKRAFDKLDKKNEGRLPSNKIGDVVRAWGAGGVPSEKFIEKLSAEVDFRHRGKFDIDTLMELMYEHGSLLYDENDLWVALDCMDEDFDQFLSYEELSTILMTKGEVLEEKDIKLLIKQLKKFSLDNDKDKIAVNNLISGFKNANKPLWETRLKRPGKKSGRKKSARGKGRPRSAKSPTATNRPKSPTATSRPGSAKSRPGSAKKKKKGGKKK